MTEPILKLHNICKYYPATTALDNVSIDFFPGEIHALAGANGCGKSTLADVICGVTAPDSGDIYFCGSLISGKKYSIRSAEKLGIVQVHQKPTLIPDFTVWENIFAGHELEHTARLHSLNSPLMQKRSKEILKYLDSDLDIFKTADSLTVQEQYIVQLSRAIAIDPKVLIIDEFSEAFWYYEMKKFHEIFAKMRAHGTCVILISHNISELVKVSDRFTIMRDGMILSNQTTDSIDTQNIVKTMLGKDIKDHYPKLPTEIGDESFKVYKLSDEFIDDIGFKLHKGEILGIAGHTGSGRSRLARLLAGVKDHNSGRFFVNGEEVTISSPEDAMRHGIVYISEQRNADCMFECMTTQHNTSISSLNSYKSLGLISENLENSRIASALEALCIDRKYLKQPIRNLSGGNQQKVLIARAFLAHAQIYILDEPTQGVDIAGKVEIYNLCNEITRRGGSIILLSSNISEVVGMSDRIIVMKKGRLICEFNRDEASQDRIFHFATNGLQTVLEHNYLK